MGHAKFTGSYEGSKYTVTYVLPLFLWQDNTVFFVYSPTLDITGYGKNETEAESSFLHTLDEFTKYTHNKGVLLDELERLGWTVNRKKKRAKSPTDEELLDDNEEYRAIAKRNDVTRRMQDVNLTFA